MFLKVNRMNYLLEYPEMSKEQIISINKKLLNEIDYLKKVLKENKITDY